MRCRDLLLLVLGLALSGASASAQQACPNRPASVPGEQLGCSVAASGDVIAYGANLGNRVLVSQGNGFQALTASDGASGDMFGFSIAIDGDSLAVGAPTADGPGGPDSGAVYVFRKQEGKWVQEAKLTAGDGAPGAQLGFAVALRGDTLVAGAATDGARGSLSGAVYVFERTGTVWTQRAKLTGARTRAFDELGAAVALDGGVLVAGAPFEDGRAGGNQGTVHLFEQRGGTWTETATLTPSGAAPGDELGFAVSIQGDTVAAGARRGDVAGRVDAGWVAVFKRDGGGWRETTRLTAGALAQAGELFGGSVSLSGARLLVGASKADGSHGATYLFEERTPGVWTLLERTKPPDDQGPGRFGFSVAMSGATVVAGAFMANGSAGFVACEVVPIQPPDVVPSLTIGDCSLAGGNSGTTPFAFTVNLSSPARDGGVTFDIATAPGTAKAGTDYVTRRLTRQTIPAGSSTYSLTVQVKGNNTLTKLDKTFFVNVTNVTGADVADGQGLGTILNDDIPGLPSLTIGDVSLNEGNSGTTGFPFTVSLSSPAPVGGVKFEIATVPGTATAGSDYIPKSLARQTIPAGNSTYTFEVLVQGDTSPEANETFFVKVSHVAGAIVAGSGRGQGTIRNDDEAVDSADLSVAKVDTPDPVPAGNNLTYTITVTNAGPSAASSVVLSDTLPAGTAFVSLASPGGWSCTKPPVGSGGTVSCTKPSLAVGSAVFSLTVAVDVLTPNGTILVNTASASSTTPDPNPGNESGTATTTVGVGSASLSVAQVDGPDPVLAGTNLTYTISVTNAGPNSAADVSLSDTLPVGTTFVSFSSPAGWSCTNPPLGSGGTVSCSKGSLALGIAVFTLTVAVPPSTPGGTILTHTASASSTTTDPNPGDESATATTTVTASADDLSITKTDGVTTATPGGSVTYTITASNAGPSNATGAAVADTFPASLTCTWTCVGAGGGTCAASGSGSINDTVNLPVGGSVIYTASCTISPSAMGTLSNTATVTVPAGVTDPTPGNNSAMDSDTLVAPAASADLSITKTDGVTAATPGGSVTYMIVASNAGPSNATGATVADTFPASLTCTWICVGAGGGTCTASGSGNINDTVVNLPFGGSVTYTASCTISPAATGTLSNTATATAPTGVADPISGNNSATDNDTLAASANLSITKTDGVTTATPGGSVTYTIVTSNAGPSNATGATVADTFPASLTCTWTCAGAGGGTCTASGSSTINDTVNLPVGGSVTYTAICMISPAATGTLSNTATVTVPAGVTDPTPSNNSATDNDTLAALANLSITKTDGVTTATPGGSVTYTIMASNAGPSNATGATVADTFPASLTCTWTCAGAAGGTCTASGFGSINDTVNLPVGGSVTYTAICTIAVLATGTLSNTATVTVPAGVTDPTPGNNSATDSDTLAASADLSITKTDGVTTATPGGSVTYTITASNAGPSNATAATVTDNFPASLTCTWTCVGAAGGTCTASGFGSINDTVNLPVGGSVTYTAICLISPSAMGTLSNTATVTVPAGVTDPIPGNNSATDSDTLVAADLSVTNDDMPDPVTAGTNLIYTLTVTNAGPSPAASVSLSDPLPAPTTFVSLTSPGGWVCTVPTIGTNGTVSCSSASLAVGSAVFTLTVAVPPAPVGVDLTNTATASSATADLNPGNNSGTTTTAVTGFSDLSVTKVNTPNPVLAGGNLTYTITVTNAGPSDSTVNNLFDTLPAGTSFLSLSSPAGWACANPPVGSGGSISCTKLSLAVGAAVFTLKAAVASSTPPGTLTNTATAFSKTPDPNPGNESGTATATVISPSTLSGTKSVSGTFMTGGTVIYTVTLTNSGPSTQPNNPGPEFTDTLPIRLTLVSASATSGTAATVGNTVTWNGMIPAGGSVMITFNATIGAGPSMTITNQGTINYDADGDGTNESTTLTNTASFPVPVVFQEDSVPAIPILDAVGLALLTLLLALGGAAMLRRWRE